MCKIVLAILGLCLGLFAGLELGAWMFYNSFDAGGLAGILIGVPLGGVVGLAGGVWIGSIIDRKEGPWPVRVKIRFLLIVASIGLLLMILVYWMSTIRPFYWIQT